MAKRCRSFLESLAEIWFPIPCARCGAAGGSPCARCLEDLQPADRIEALPPLDQIVALVRYDETSRPFIADLKYRGVWASARVLGPAMAALIEESFGDETADLTLTWAPTTPRRVRDRGFDQAEVLAREIGHRSNLRVERLLERVAGPAQTGRSRSERAHGVAFIPTRSISGPVIVIDDVVTTGATFRAAGRALFDAGSSSVVAIALAATPEH